MFDTNLDKIIINLRFNRKQRVESSGIKNNSFPEFRIAYTSSKLIEGRKKENFLNIHPPLFNEI